MIDEALVREWIIALRGILGAGCYGEAEHEMMVRAFIAQQAQKVLDGLEGVLMSIQEGGDDGDNA